MSSPEDRPAPFRIEIEPHRATLVMAVQGEIDIYTAGQLGAQFQEILEGGFERIIVDLRRVSFMDSTGLRTIINADAASRRANVPFALVQGPSQVQRVFELTATDEVLPFVRPEDIDVSAG